MPKNKNDIRYYMPSGSKHFRLIYDYSNDKFYLTKMTVNPNAGTIASTANLGYVLLSRAGIFISGIIAPFFVWFYDVPYPFIWYNVLAIIFGYFYKKKIYPQNIQKYTSDGLTEITLEEVKRTYLFRISVLYLVTILIVLAVISIVFMPLEEDILFAKILAVITYITMIPFLIVESNIKGYILIIKRIIQK